MMLAQYERLCQSKLHLFWVVVDFPPGARPDGPEG